MRLSLIFLGISAVLAFSADATAQDSTAAEPTVGLRDLQVEKYLLENARVVTAPGEILDGASVLIEDTSIAAVGTAVEAPTGAKRIDCQGKTIYAGLIDAWSEVEVPRTKDGSLAGYWNANVTPQRSAGRVAAGELPDASKLRGQGITARVIAPEGGIVKGSSCVVLLSGTSSGRRMMQGELWQHLQLTVPRRGGAGERYPNSPMGAVALLRQAMLDAQWYDRAWDAHRSDRSLPRPETNVALETLADALTGQRFVVDAPNERMALRADGLAKEFSLDAILRGSGREYRWLEEIAATRRPILLPVDFPDAPPVTTTDAAREVTLRELIHWHLAPENPARLADAGAKFCLTTDGLDDPGKFLKQVRRAVRRGLAPEAALAAVTTTPAALLGVDQSAGRVRPGMLASLVITDGDLFEDETKVVETWVAGERFEVQKPKAVGVDEMVGRWALKLSGEHGGKELFLDLTRKKDKLAGTLRPQDESEAKPEGKPKAKLKNVVRQRDRLTAAVDLHSITDAVPPGTSQLTLMTLPEGEAGKPATFGTLLGPGGGTSRLSLRYVGEIPPEEADKDEDRKQEEDEDEQQVEHPGAGATKDDEPVEDPDGDEKADPQESGKPTPPADELAGCIEVMKPLGAYGLNEPPAQPEVVLFRDATVWTCGEAGKIERGDVLVREGVIVEIGTDVEPPKGCRVINLAGKHLTPGLIDCHSHMATDGGVNESGQAVTAEVRIGDFIDNSDINIYRQLAGGLTVVNILHGSANPIGGQNAVIKLRWGAAMDGLKMKGAPAGIKFALGENVKRNTSRYPNTRMGVEQIIRDQFLAAREYAAAWRRWDEGQRDGLPPRRDLQLEALAEVQRGQRWIHCHSYRQDEIVATLDVLEEFGIQIGTLQHILEGYKVADRLAEHGAMASAFSDWWAYKFEVYDAIPYNGVLMHDAGVVVSYNSDDRELARHLNTEAAKATKYGGVPEQEALKFVTLNPAKQLRIDDRVGSIEVGKDADLVVWSGRPLSTTTRCEQTWIEGRRYFDLEADQRLRERDAKLRTRLIQLALGDKDDDGEDKKDENEDEPEIAEEDRWVRYDVYCGAGGQAARQRAADKAAAEAGRGKNAGG